METMKRFLNGEYEFVLADEDSLTIRIKFTINADGNVSYSEPTFV